MLEMKVWIAIKPIKSFTQTSAFHIFFIRPKLQICNSFTNDWISNKKLNIFISIYTSVCMWECVYVCICKCVYIWNVWRTHDNNTFEAKLWRTLNFKTIFTQHSFSTTRNYCTLYLILVRLSFNINPNPNQI